VGFVRALFRKLRNAIKRRPVVVRSWELTVISDILERRLPDITQVHDFRFFWQTRLTEETITATRQLLAAHDFDALINYPVDASPAEYPREYLILASFRNQTGKRFFALIYDSDLLEQYPELILYESA